MTDRNGTALAPHPSNDLLSFECDDVTGTHSVTATDVQKILPAGTVARALAARMSLPENVPWALRDQNAAFLVDDLPIGDQISPGAKLTVTAKTHLGAL
jgi:hypothetical protein